MMLALLETFLGNLIAETTSGITSSCSFPPRINEVSREIKNAKNLATSVGKPKIPSSSPTTNYVQR